MTGVEGHDLLLEIMPLIAWLVGAYLAGLLAGFSGAGGMVGIAMTGVGLAAAVVSRPRLAVAALLVAGGSWSAISWTTSRHSCARAAALNTVMRLRLDDEASPGAYARGTLACGARVSVFVARGRAAAGAIVLAQGTIDVDADTTGLTLRAAAIRQTEGAHWTAKLRATAAGNVDRDFGSDAPLVRALVLADMRGMSPEIRDRWAVAGMVHMLSVSGLHVGIIAVVTELLLVACRVNRRTAPVVAVLLIAVYVSIIGAPAPAVRSAVMLGLRALTRMAQRHVSPWAILAVGAAHPIVTPDVVLDLGYQLSVVGVAALIAAGHLVKRLPLRRRPKWVREVGAGLACTVIATIASLPLVAWTMGRVSLIAPLSNLAAGPFVAAAQPVLFLGVLLGPLPGAAKFVADAAHPLLAAMDGVAVVAAAVPGASITVWPTASAAIVTAVVSIAVLCACMEKHSLGWSVVALAGIALLAWLPEPGGGRMTELHMIDVGQGDAIALRTRGGHWVLFDAGRTWDGGDAGRRTVVPYVAHLGGPVAAFVLSHPHADHVGGAASVISALHPARFVDGAFVLANEAYRESLVAARAAGTHWQRVHPGDSIVVDEATITFLAPDSAFAAALPDPNNASAVAVIRVGDVRMLMMGDAEHEEEDWLLAHYPEGLNAQVLKVGHHGSSTSSTAAFLDAVRPRIALVSVGAGNTYGHPSAAVMETLTERGAIVVRSDKTGTAIVETDGSIVRLRRR
jgi:competence protein ComEC